MARQNFTQTPLFALPSRFVVFRAFLEAHISSLEKDIELKSVT